MNLLLRRFAAAFAVASGASGLLAAQSVTLQIKPKVGDTLRLRIEQEMEITAAGRMRDVDTTMTMRSSMLMLSRSIVVLSDDDGTTVRSITDSVAVNPGALDPRLDQVRRALQGKEVRVRFSREGSATLVEADPELPRDLHSVFSQLPATFPRHQVAVGSTWKQRIPIPDAAQGQIAGTLQAVFRLDSLTNRGKRAFISMRGTLSRDSTASVMADGGRMTMTGTVTGFMILDRVRGWVIDALTEMSVQSHIEPAAGKALPPVKMRMRLIQRQRTMDKD
ncbi:MAG TPA: DUF6263 family protein [Gemmatimonadaceae bacterium]|nr:DUF6263 family protein [Gemmatimonadaceae bacterium]